jgi:hypothetical protein
MVFPWIDLWYWSLFYCHIVLVLAFRKLLIRPILMGCFEIVNETLPPNAWFILLFHRLAIVKDRKRRPKGGEWEPQTSHEIFRHCPKFTAKHAKQSTWCPWPKWVAWYSLGTQRDTTQPMQKTEFNTGYKRANHRRNKLSGRKIKPAQTKN